MVHQMDVIQKEFHYIYLVIKNKGRILCLRNFIKIEILKIEKGIIQNDDNR